MTNEIHLQHENQFHKQVKRAASEATFDTLVGELLANTNIFLLRQATHPLQGLQVPVSLHSSEHTPGISDLSLLHRLYYHGFPKFSILYLKNSSHRVKKKKKKSGMTELG